MSENKKPIEHCQEIDVYELLKREAHNGDKTAKKGFLRRFKSLFDKQTNK